MAKGPLDIQNPPDGDYQKGGGSSTSSGSGGESYSNTRGSFVATPNTGTKTITITSQIAALLAVTLSSANFVSGAIKKIDSSGVVTSLPLTTVQYDVGTGVLTVSDMTAAFTAGDIVEVILTGPNRSYDKTNDLQNVSLKTALAGEDIPNDLMKVEQRFGATHISTATTTLVKTGVGFLHLVNVNTKGTVASTITIYDNTSATGTVLAVIDSLNLSGGFVYDVAFSVGLTIVTTGTVAPDVTVSSR
jgi:hypothetical protein